MQTTVYKHPSELIPYEDNPRENDNAVPYLMNSIKDFGFWGDIIITRENVIVAGHTRVKAVLALLEEGDCGKWGEKGQNMAPLVPCVIADTMSQQEIDAFRIVDNKIAELSYWKRDTLEKELDRLRMDWENYGFEPMAPLEPLAGIPVIEAPEVPAVPDIAPEGTGEGFSEDIRLMVFVPPETDEGEVESMLREMGCGVKRLE